VMPTLDPETAEYSASITSAMLDAWTVVDSTHRLRELLMQFPDVKQRLAHLQVFYRRTASVERFRNLIQHLRRKIDALALNGLPVWGSLTWRLRTDPTTSEETSFGICPGTFFDGAKVFLSEFGERMEKPIGMVCLNIGNASLDLGALVESATPIITYFERTLAEQFRDEPLNGADLLLKIKVKPVLRE